MSVDILRDSASDRSQRRRNLKGEGYNKRATISLHRGVAQVRGVGKSKQ